MFGKPAGTRWTTPGEADRASPAPGSVGHTGGTRHCQTSRQPATNDGSLRRRVSRCRRPLTLMAGQRLKVPLQLFLSREVGRHASRAPYDECRREHRLPMPLRPAADFFR